MIVFATLSPDVTFRLELHSSEDVGGAWNRHLTFGTSAPDLFSLSIADRSSRPE